MNPSKQKSPASLFNGHLTENSRQWPWLVILAILIVLPYAQTKSHDFINWDDPYYIYNNPVVSSGLSSTGIAWAFTTGITANWHPLTWISHMLDVSLFGPTPATAHMINILWYIGCVILIFFLFLRLGASSPAAFFMAAFFGIHPLHVESVAWASERKDLLCAFFFLSSTLLYLGYAREKKMPLYFLTTFTFVLSLLSKPMAVTWPCVALLLDYWPLKRFKNELKKVFYEKMPWFILTIFSSIVTIIVQNKNETVKSLVDFPISDRLANAVISYAVYIRQSFWPSDLTIFYPYPYHINTLSFIAACIILSLITFVAIRQRQKHPHLLWGLLFYLGVLFPVIGIMQVGGQAHADRYTLLPQLGIILGLGLFLDKSVKNIKIRQTVAMIMTVIIIILAGLTFRQVSYWKDNKTLFNQNLAVAGENELAHFNLGAAYLENNKLELAIIHLSAAAEMNPMEVTTYNNLGIAYLRQNKLSQAEACFRKAIFINSAIAQPHFHLAVIKIKQGNPSEAIKHFDKAVRLAPDWLEAKKLRDEVKILSTGNSSKTN
jgi:tetratricopeptide (TPR) repeat protein